MTLKVIDQFTVRSGKWEIDPRPYGLTKEAFEKYSSWAIPGGGGDHHIFVHSVAGDFVEFFNSDGLHDEDTCDEYGWCNFPMFGGSEYWPPSEGPWIIKVNGVEVARGLGLPEGYHVSTFLIVDDVDEGSHPTPIPAPGEIVSHIQVIVDGVMVFDNWSDK